MYVPHEMDCTILCLCFDSKDLRAQLQPLKEEMGNIQILRSPEILVVVTTPSGFLGEVPVRTA